MPWGLGGFAFALVANGSIHIRNFGGHWADPGPLGRLAGEITVVTLMALLVGWVVTLLRKRRGRSQ